MLGITHSPVRSHTSIYGFFACTLEYSSLRREGCGAAARWARWPRRGRIGDRDHPAVETDASAQSPINLHVCSENILTVPYSAQRICRQLKKGAVIPFI